MLETTGMSFCSQKSAVMSVIIMALIISLMPEAVLTGGGNSSMDLFYCEAPGCAANVTQIFCDEKPIFEKMRPIADCSGPPPLWGVCQFDGRVFLSALKGSHCDFEGGGLNIPSNKCADHDPMCFFAHAATPSPSSPPTTPSATPKTMGPSVGPIIGYTILGVFCVAVVLCGVLMWWWCRNRRRREREQTQDPTRDPEENIPLGGIQTSGDDNESNQANGGLDPDVPQRGHGD